MLLRSAISKGRKSSSGLLVTARPATNFSHIVGHRIRSLVRSIGASDPSATTAELLQLANLYGGDAHVFVMRCLADELDSAGASASAGGDAKAALLRDQLDGCARRQSFATDVCGTFPSAADGSGSGSGASATVTEERLARIAATLGLQACTRVMLGVALAQHPDDAVAREGGRFLRSTLRALDAAHTQAPLPDALLHAALHYVDAHDDLCAFRGVLSREPGAGDADAEPLPLRAALGEEPLLQHQPQLAGQALGALVAAATHPAALMLDLGFACTATAAAFSAVLEQSPNPLTEKDVALILAAIAKPVGPQLKDNIGLLIGATGNVVSPQATSSAQPPSGWNVAVISEVLQQMCPRISWQLVLRALDSPEFTLVDQRGLALIMDIYKRCCRDPFPLAYLFEEWHNSTAQLSFLRVAISAPPEVFPWQSASPARPSPGSPKDSKTQQASAAAATSATTSPPPPPSACSPWSVVPLLETLLRISECAENASSVRALFELPLKQCPETLFVGLAQVKSGWNTTLRRELIGNLSNMFFGAHPNTTVVHKLWQTSNTTVIQALRDMYLRDRAALSHILDVAHSELKAHMVQILPSLLDARPFVFAIDLASLASQREYLNLELWLVDKLAKQGEAFARAAAGFLRDKLQQKAAASNPPAHPLKTPVSNFIITADIQRVFFKVLQSQHLPQDLVQEAKDLETQFATPQPQADQSTAVPAAAAAAGVAVAVPPTAVTASAAAPATTTTAEEPTAAQQPTPQPPKEEQNANQLFDDVYKGKITVEELITTLRNFRVSKVTLEKEIFKCMVNSLFTEFQYLARYPPTELQITGKIFGLLIQEQLIMYQALGDALKAVLEALRQPVDTNHFKFGTLALEQFLPRLRDWPQYSACLFKIPHLQTARPDLFDVVQGVVSVNPSTSPAPQKPVPTAATPADKVRDIPEFRPKSLTPQQPPPPPSQQQQQQRPAAADEYAMHTSLPIDTLRRAQRAPVVEPETRVADRMHFIVNNVAQANLDQKATEMRSLLKPESAEYLAQYLVTSRVSIEPNNHLLYQAFIDAVNGQLLWPPVLRATYDNLRALLSSDRMKTEQSERQLLKSLGSWLGLITLAKNKAITHNDLPVKDLLIQAVHDDNVAPIVMFVCSILGHCAQSKVFKPPNPWVVALLKVLAEIYFLPGLRQNTQFEIEHLMSALGQSVEKLRPTASLLQSTATPTPSLTPSGLTPQPTTSPAPGLVGAPAVSPPPPPAAPNVLETLQQTLQSSVSVSGAALLLPQVQVQHLVAITVAATEKAIREVFSPVVNRTATVTSVAVRELVCKDFALEPDENKLRRASHLMAASLAQSLVLVTCREPLRVSMIGHINQSLHQYFASGMGVPGATGPVELSPAQQLVLDQAVQALCTENLDIGFGLIERAASEKSLQEIEEALAPCYDARRNYREMRTRPYFVDDPFYKSSRGIHIPEILRPQPPGLTQQQLQVYEDFAGIPRMPQADKSGAQSQQDKQLQPHQVIERFNALIAELDAAVSAIPPELQHQQLNMLPSDSTLVKAVSNLVSIFAGQSTPAELAPHGVQALFSRVVDSASKPLAREASLGILEAAASFSQPVVATVPTFYLATGEERRLSVPVALGLVHARLLSPAELDSQLAQSLLAQRLPIAARELATAILHECISGPRKPTTLIRDDIPQTLDALAKLATRGLLPADIVGLAAEARALPTGVRKPASALPIASFSAASSSTSSASAAATLSSVAAHIDAVREKAAITLYNWAAATSDEMRAKLTEQVQADILSPGDDSHDAFFRACTELAVDGFSMCGLREDDADAAFYLIDAYARLATSILQRVEAAAARTMLLGRVLSALVKVLLREHDEQGALFDQRPYARLLDLWLSDLTSPAAATDADAGATNTFCNLFTMLHPSRVPGFAFAWLGLIAHRSFMPRLLLSKGQRLWPVLQRLLVDLLHFLSPQLRAATDMGEPVRALYRGAVRVFLVILHDFPEFLCEFHFSLCDAIPPTCVQLRNLILSAFPRNMRLPDPFTPNLKVDLLPEIQVSPRVTANFAQTLAAAGIKTDLDAFLRTCAPPSFPIELCGRLLLDGPSTEAAGTRFNVPLVNALVMYIGTQAIAHIQSKTAATAAGPGAAQPIVPAIAHNAPMDLFHHLANSLDPEGRYIFLNAIANQLRFPNTHTHYFSCVLLYLFADAPSEAVQEQITRVLLERLIVNRPHPWGLLITFIELIKNPRYSFWSHSFTRCAPEIERLFESVARSCMQPQQQAQQQQQQQQQQQAQSQQ